MGFDNECILNIQSLAGEYFCPVCRLLVYPDEAMQSQCTHLYCKPCLTYVVSTTRACPYDGYLVTTADSKPLIESNKALAETIGKVAVHCLYNRSGCTWQGPLTDCITHCSGCAFGNSPVVCNRCGIQIVHRQVLEHAQNCPGIQPQVQQVGTTEPSSNVTASAVDQNQPATQSAPEASQVQASQPTTILSASGQVSNQPIISSSQGQGLTQSTALTQEQWYQQQQQHYQQYYQQYPGYDPYQQQYQQYYPYQQPASIQPQPSNLSSQHQTQGLMQPQPQNQTQPLPQVQVQPQSQLPPPPPLYMVHGQSQSTTESQTSTTTVPQTHVQFNTQQQTYPSGNTHSHIPPQIHPSPISHSHPQPLSYPQAQPHPQQSTQTLHYQQSHPHAQNQQGQIQQQAYPQLQPQQHSVSQSQSQHHTLPQTQIPQHNQPINTNMQPQMQNPPTHAVTGLHSYPPPQPHQQLLTGVPQPTIQTPSQTGSLLQPHPNQMQDHLPQQPPMMRPMQSHVTYPNQQHPPSLLSPAQAQNTSHVPQLPTSVHAQQPGHTGNHRPIMNAVHQLTPQQQIQQKPHFVQQGQHLPQQVPASHLGSHGLPHALAQHNIGYLHPNTTMPYKMQQNQSQNLAGWPMGVSHGVQSLSHSQSMTVSHLRQIQTRENIPSTYQSHDYRNNTRVQQGDQPSLESARRTMIDGHAGHKDTADKEGKLTSQKAAQTVVNDSDVKPVIRGNVNELKSVKSEAEADPVDQKYCLNGKVKSGNEALGSQLLDGGSWEPLTKETEGKTDAKESAFDHSVVDISGNGVTKDPKEIDGVESKQMQHSDGENKEIGVSLLKNPSSQDANYVEQIGMPMTTPAGGHESLKATPNPSASFDDSPLSEKRKLAHHDAFHEKGQQHTSGFVQTSHSVPVVDQGRHQLQSNNSGPSTPPMLPAPPSGQLYPQAFANPPMQYRLQAPGYPEHAALTSEHYLQSAIPEPGSAASFGMRPGNYTSPHQGEAQFLGLDQYPPSHGASNMPLVSSSGGHDLLDHVGARARLRISEAQLGIPHPHPIHHIGNEIIPNLMPEGGRPGSAEQGPPQLAAMHMRMNVAPGFESSLIPDEKFKLMGTERMKLFSLDSARGEFQDDFKQLNRLSHLDTEPFQNYGAHPLRNLDRGIHGPNHVSDLQLDSLGGGGAAAASRFFPPHNLGRGFNPSYERREITRRTDLAHGHRDFFGSDLGYHRHHLDGLGPRSTFQDYHRNNSRGYGGLPGISSFDEIDGREMRRFGDSFSNTLSESRYPFSSRSEFDGHGNFSMGEHLRSGDFIGRDRHYDHLRLGERSGLGAHPGHGLMGELDRFGRVEAFGLGNRQSHLRPGEPGFRSSFSLQGFPDDNRIYSGDTDASGGWRKRRSLSMGWCRICKVDCATVEGLDLHSQTREHQKMAMDMVQCIKQSAKKQKLSASENPLSEDADRSTNGDLEGQKKSIK